MIANFAAGGGGGAGAGQGAGTGGGGGGRGECTKLNISFSPNTSHGVPTVPKSIDPHFFDSLLSLLMHLDLLIKDL